MQKWWILVAAVLMFFSVTVVDTQSTEAATGSQVVSEGKKLQGTSYQWGGRTPSTGFDCSGFVRYAYGQAGIDLPFGTANQVNEGSFVERSNLQPGDIVFFSGTYRSGVSHNGIYVGDNQFIHASASQGVTITSMNNSYWAPKYHSARRIASSGGQEVVASTADSTPSSQESTSSSSSSASSSSADSATVVNTSRVNVRDGGSLSASVIDGINGGTTVEVEAVYNYWAKVSVGSTEGFVSLNFLDLDSSGGSTSASVSSGDAEVINSSNVNVRSGASLSDSVVGSISGGTDVEVIEEHNYWAKVSDGSTEGYVSLRFLDN